MDLASVIDHTLLRSEALEADIRRLCEEALKFRFYSVCVNSFWIPVCKEELRNSTVKIATTIGFPLGASLALSKREEARLSLAAGAHELDMVMNIGALKSGLYNEVADEIRAIHALKSESPFRLKVILETSVLSREEKIRAAELALASGADFLKTSTGFANGGATVEDVKLLKEIANGAAEIKASGGIRDRRTAEALLGAGATRLGTSQSVAIVSGEVLTETTTQTRSAY